MIGLQLDLESMEWNEDCFLQKLGLLPYPTEAEIQAGNSCK